MNFSSSFHSWGWKGFYESSTSLPSYLCNFLSTQKHVPASALFISVREAPVELSLGSHYYRADAGEAWDRQSGQIKREIKKGNWGQRKENKEEEK